MLMSFNFCLFSLKQWTECRFNIRPSPNSNRHVQVNGYPENYNESAPYVLRDIDYEQIYCRKINSRSKSNAFGVFWKVGGKNCSILIAIDDNDTYRRFSRYLKKLLKFFELYNNIENGM